MTTSTRTDRFIITGQRVTLEHYSNPSRWVATGWEQGLPVCRKPITDKEAWSVIDRFGATHHAY